MLTWTVALVVAGAGMSAWEYRLRELGFRPSVSDSPALWALHRSHVYQRDGGDSVLVLVGASRMAQGVSLPALRRSLPGFRVVQLAIAGGRGWDVLADLARDSAFAGAVIASFADRNIVYHGTLSQEYVDYFHAGRKADARFNTWIDARVQDQLALRLSLTRLQRLITVRARGWRLEPNYVAMDFDRGRLTDFSLVRNLHRHRDERLGIARRNADRWSTDRGLADTYSDTLAVLAGLVGAINARGGRVALVHFPVAPDFQSQFDRVFPRSRFWNTIEQTVPATVVHYLDHPSLRRFEPPDGSHLDQRDTEAFTVELVRILKRRGFFSIAAGAGSAELNPDRP